MAAILRLEDISLTLGEGERRTPILKNISLTLESNQSVAIIGPSGSGKSSLLMVMSGLEPPSSGHVYWNDENITKLTEDQRAVRRGKKIGLVFQSFHLIPTMTAWENVSLPLELAGDKQASQKAKQRLEDVQLSHRLHHKPTELSGGEQQRVAIARALIANPEIIMADEPTGNLDEKTGETITELLFSLQAQQKTTLVMITHDLNLANRCQHQWQMHQGHLHPLQKPQSLPQNFTVKT